MLPTLATISMPSAGHAIPATEPRCRSRLARRRDPVWRWRPLLARRGQRVEVLDGRVVVRQLLRAVRLHDEPSVGHRVGRDRLRPPARTGCRAGRSARRWSARLQRPCRPPGALDPYIDSATPTVRWGATPAAFADDDELLRPLCLGRAARSVRARRSRRRPARHPRARRRRPRPPPGGDHAHVPGRHRRGGRKLSALTRRPSSFCSCFAGAAGEQVARAGKSYVSANVITPSAAAAIDLVGPQLGRVVEAHRRDHLGHGVDGVLVEVVDALGTCRARRAPAGASGPASLRRRGSGWCGSAGPGCSRRDIMNARAELHQSAPSASAPVIAPAVTSLPLAPTRI